MRARRRTRARRLAPVAALVLLLPALAACEREERRFREIPPTANALPAVVQNEQNQPGTIIVNPDVSSPYDYNAQAISDGKLLYTSLNCAGCHSPRGGGSMGPSLIDSLWIYGSAPENIFSTIVEGRPRGMPAFRGRLGTTDVWKLVAYVRYLSGHTAQDTRPGRDDAIYGTTPDAQEALVPTIESRIPPELRPPERRRPAPAPGDSQ
ncbi:MAG TPA: c-type cytochrome [Gemmatimonadaceae bacterium]|nr:c-type cytochrome [Gemmatimonadaceae bacterium]